MTVEGRHDNMDFRCEVRFVDNTNGPPPTYRDECVVNFEVIRKYPHIYAINAFQRYNIYGNGRQTGDVQRQ